MSNAISYSNPDDEFGEIIYKDPELKRLIDAEDREVDFSDENTLIIENDVLPVNESNPDFWSDR